MSRLPFELSVAKPCEQQWNAMRGTSTQRHCDSCNKSVHNLAALTPAQIERLIFETPGELCARITRRDDGSLVTRPALVNRAATVVVAAGLSFAGNVYAQSSGSSAKAIVSGDIYPPDSNYAGSKWIVTLLQNGEAKKVVLSDSAGTWQTEVTPGTYDVQIRRINGFAEAHVNGVTLHPGEQSFAPLRAQSETMTVTTGGALATQTSVIATLSYWLRHPVRYLAHVKQSIL